MTNEGSGEYFVVGTFHLVFFGGEASRKGSMEMIFAVSPNKDLPSGILIKIKKQLLLLKMNDTII